MMPKYQTEKKRFAITHQGIGEASFTLEIGCTRFWVTKGDSTAQVRLDKDGIFLDAKTDYKDTNQTTLPYRIFQEEFTAWVKRMEKKHGRKPKADAT